MQEILKMRLPTCKEWDWLADLTGEDASLIHWESILSWCQNADSNRPSYRAVRGYCSVRHWSYYKASTQLESVGFRPAIELGDNTPPDGTVVVVGTLYMGGQPVKIPTNPTQDGDILDYIPGSKLELRRALTDKNYQLRAIQVGDILIADQVLLKNISWKDADTNIVNHAAPADESPRKIESVRLPSNDEWDKMIDVTVGVDSRVHWRGSYSWCSDKYSEDPSRRIARGLYAGRSAAPFPAESRMVNVGFRPVFAIENSENIPEGKTVTVGTLYMDGQPVLANHNGAVDVPIYNPAAFLEFREPVDDPLYQIKAIKVGDVLIADRILLREISWDDLDKLSFCGDANEQNVISKGDVKMELNQAVIYIGDSEHGTYTIVCSHQNEQKVRAALTKWYPKWVKRFSGRVPTLWGVLEDNVGFMKDLLEDENMELLGMSDKAIIRLEDEVYGTCAIVCSRKNEYSVNAFLSKRYPMWASKCIGKPDETPWNDVISAVNDMKELLGDNNLEFLGECKDIRIPLRQK